MLLTMFAFGALSTLAMEGLLFYIHLIRLMKTVSIGKKGD